MQPPADLRHLHKWAATSGRSTPGPKRNIAAQPPFGFLSENPGRSKYRNSGPLKKKTTLHRTLAIAVNSTVPHHGVGKSELFRCSGCQGRNRPYLSGYCRAASASTAMKPEPRWGAHPGCQRMLVSPSFTRLDRATRRKYVDRTICRYCSWQ